MKRQRRTESKTCHQNYDSRVEVVILCFLIFLSFCCVLLVTYDLSYDCVVDIHKLFTACLNVRRSAILEHVSEL